ncbi:MAG TPA: CorA family divalent cation transporter, partial [Bryobacteraceae bacterium]|nr:CorA family divalent cation transporter [Bryobacteraceae bacterium]
LTSDLRADFLHFSNYWYFEELANKDEEIEHFTLGCREYRVDQMKQEIEEEIDKLNVSLHNYYQFRNTEAVNRLAMLSLLLGAGAVATGFFGMNFEGEFERFFFKPSFAGGVFHNTAIVAVAMLGLGAIGFGAYMIVSNWGDYRESLLPRWWLDRGARRQRSLRRSGPGVLPGPRI